MVTTLQILQVAKKDIVKFFEESPQQIYDYSEIKEIIEDNTENWRLPKTLTANKFLAYLTQNTQLKQNRLEFKRPIIKYTWGDVSPYQLFQSLRKGAYFSHYSSVYFHNLTEQLPKTFYVNAEQKPKPFARGKLAQGRIDFAFQKPTRMSQNYAKHKNIKVFILEGMFTDNLGITEINDSDGNSLRLTNIERTLIDITVRPEYSGGIYEVLKSYQLAKDKVSINHLAAMLRQLNYIYPFHQAIGFYLERAGYRDSQIKLLQDFDFEYDFYLMHQMKEKSYSKKWKLFYPKGFD